jgi:hypothetical protein
MNLQVLNLGTANLEILKGWVPSAPAAAVEAPVAAYTTKSSLPQTLVTVLTPFARAEDLPEVKSVTGDDSRIARLSLTYSNGEKAEVAISDVVRELRIGTVTGTGRALVVRTGGNRTERQSLLLPSTAPSKTHGESRRG